MTRTPGGTEVLLVTGDAELPPALAPGLDAAGFRLVTATTVDAARLAARSAGIELAIVDGTVGCKVSYCISELARINAAIASIIVIGADEVETAVEAARCGSYDFLTRPVEASKVPIRLRVALEKHRNQLHERAYRLALEERINSRTEELHQNRVRLQTQLMATIESLSKALQWKDNYTEGHSRRVSSKSAECARALRLKSDEIRHIELAALFHDIGKIGIRDEVLNKPGQLSREEYEHMKRHPLVAEQILSPIMELRPIIPIVKHEHERWDGGGYPEGLRGEQIPLGSRIIAVVDAWDSMVFDRVYRPALPVEEVLVEIERSAGRMFDPDVVRAFCAMERARIPTQATEA